MLALVNLAYSAFMPTWQHIQLLILFEQLFISNEFKTFILFYDNGTVDIANNLLGRLAAQSTQHHDIVTYNIDHHQPAQRNRDFIAEPFVPDTLGPCFARSVSVELFVDHDSMQVRLFRMEVYWLKPQSKWIRVYLGHMHSFINFYRYTAVVELTENAEVQLSTYNYQQRQPLQLFSDSPLTMYQQLFFDQRIDMLGEQLYMWGDMDVPNLFRATTFNSGGKKVLGVAGLYAAICAMIGQYFNASVRFTSYERSIGGILKHDHVGAGASKSMVSAAASASAKAEVELEYAAYERLRQRVYRSYYVMPGVENTMVHCVLYDEFMAIGHSMYPHRQENYVVLVPNERQHPPELWLVLSSSPLMIIWVGAIINFTKMRCLIRWVERRRLRRRGRRADQIPCWDLDRLVLETCGLSFGWAIALRPTGRADRVLLLSVSVFAIVSGVLCSGLLLKQFAFGDTRPKVDTLAELNRMPNMTIVLPIGLAVNETMWNSNYTLMHMPLAAIYGEILKKNIKCTFVLPESVADVLMSEEQMSEDNFQVFHKLRERVLSMHMSMYTTHDIITHNLNQLLQRLHYHGLISHFEKQAHFALGVRGTRSTSSSSSSTSSSTTTSDLSSISSSITLNELSFIIWLVMYGQLSGLAVFGAELLVARMQTFRDRKRMEEMAGRYWFLN